jgi:hypothetical protein
MAIANGKAQGGKGNDGRFGLKAKLVAGVAVLGCAAALAFGGVTRSESQPAAQAAQPATSVLDWEQAERAQVAPAQAIVILDWEQAERGQVAPVLSVATLDWEQAERTQVASSLPFAPLDWEQEERRQVAP